MVNPVSTAVTGVDSTTLAGSTPSLDLSVWGMFAHADIVVQLVIIGLLLSSFWCWAVIFEKWFLFRVVKAKAQRFENDFWSSEALDQFHDKIKKRPGHPMANIFIAAMEEWSRSKNTKRAPTTTLKVGLADRIVQVMLVARNREIERLERGLGFLATTGSSAPFIGLFGTVWGIMHSFHSIALTKNTSLVAVAPGIAEALFATAIGLFAAIPAVIAYNRFNTELAHFANKLEDFSTEFDTILSRQMEE